MIPKINAILVCVGYDDFLQLTISRTLQHVSKLVVVTSPTDHKTIALCRRYPFQVTVHATQSFYDNGAAFNKGKALEEGFDVLGRNGWILVMDADIVLPVTMSLPNLAVGSIYTPPRRIMSNIRGLSDISKIDPKTLPLRQDRGNYGYFQLFHAADRAISELPRYQTDWRHAGGADSAFEKRWAKHNRHSLPFEVVHLGDPDQNWFGRATPRVDDGTVPPNAAKLLAEQEALHRKYGWKGRPKTGEPVIERIGSNPAAPEPAHVTDKTRRIVDLTMRKVPVRPKGRRWVHRPPNK